VIQLLGDFFQRFLEVTEIHHHAARLCVCRKRIRAHLRHHTPAMPVQIAAFSGVPFEKVRRVKMFFRF
jgi:hypothetical protein